MNGFNNANTLIDYLLRLRDVRTIRATNEIVGLTQKIHNAIHNAHPLDQMTFVVAAICGKNGFGACKTTKITKILRTESNGRYFHTWERRLFAANRSRFH